MPNLNNPYRRTSSDWIDISISVVVFEHNPAELCALLEALSSKNLRLEITVVDNSSTRKLEPIAISLGANYIKTARNLGFGAAHNIVLRQQLGRAKYHLVVNPDITVTHGVLDHIFDFMEQNPEVGQSMPRVLNPDGTQQMLCKLLPGPTDLFARRFLSRFTTRPRAQYELRHVDLSRPARVPCLSGCFMFLRDEVLRQTGIFDERYFLYMEDFDLCRRIGACSSTVFVPQVSVTHGYAKGSYRDSRLLRYHLISAWKYFNKWGWWSDSQRRMLNRHVGPFESKPIEAAEPQLAAFSKH